MSAIISPFLKQPMPEREWIDISKYAEMGELRFFVEFTAAEQERRWCHNSNQKWDNFQGMKLHIFFNSEKESIFIEVEKNNLEPLPIQPHPNFQILLAWSLWIMFIFPFRDTTETTTLRSGLFHDDVIKWKHFPCYWPFMRGIHRSQMNSPHKGQGRGVFVFSLICAWINGWVNNDEPGDLRRRRAHYDVTVI